MEMKNNTILITGGTSGIGLSLAKRFVALGNTVIICGRSESKLAAAKQAVPELHTYRFDVSRQADREALHQQILHDFPDLNILFNNAGVMCFSKLDDLETWPQAQQEITTNLEAPIHLSMLFTPHLSKQHNAAIINTTSGLSHVPLIMAAVYSATKAALNSFTISLRAQLADKMIQVIEVSPPHVNTDLGAPGANTAGMPLDEFTDVVMAGLEHGELEITCGFSTQAASASGKERELLFWNLNQPALVGSH